MANRRRQVLFVAGLSYSGSTVVDLILGNRPGGFSLGEVYAWYRPWRAKHLDPPCTCGQPLDACDIWRRVGHPRARHLHRTVADTLASTTVVDSSKDLSWIRDAYRWTAADGMEPHVVLSWRRPQGVAYSYWKRGAGGSSIDKSTGRLTSKPSWMMNLEGYVRRLNDLRVGYHVLNFDQLITDPAVTLNQLHAGIGMETWPRQERFWEVDYHGMFGSGTTRKQLGGTSAKLEQPELPPAFLEYWDRMPDAWRNSLDELNDTVVRRGRTPFSARRLPPPWYVKSRWVGYQRTRAVRRPLRSVAN